MKSASQDSITTNPEIIQNTFSVFLFAENGELMATRRLSIRTGSALGSRG